MSEDFEEWPERFIIEKPNGEPIELDEETTQKLYAIARRDKVTPQQALSTMLTAEYMMVKATEPLIEQATNKLLRGKR